MFSLALGSSAASLAAPAPARPWLNPALSAAARTDLVLAQMTEAEKLTLVFGYFGEHKADSGYLRPSGARYGSAGYVPGIPRLGIPPQWETDAGVGVATQHDSARFRLRTSLPSGLATAATWNPALAYRGGAMIGSEARDSGFNVMLAGGVNLVRDPRNGRNFEYAGEDPLLAGTMVGAQIRGIQSNHIVSTIKHYALNNQETGRFVLNARIDPAAARMSDLLAFEIAIADSNPGSVMCAYNRVNGPYACEDDWLLNQVLKRDWAYKGYVMSDWGATHSATGSAVNGLDQQSGAVFDDKPWFAAPLKAALASGEVPKARLDDMAGRIVRTMFALGMVDRPVSEKPIDLAAHATVTQADAEEAMVLLKNQHALLPLPAAMRRIAVIGSHADVGVLSGGGSSQVYPVGGVAVPGLGPKTFPGPTVYFPSSPMKAIAAQARGAAVQYADGGDAAAAARLAAQSDVAVVFVHQWTGEALDSSIILPDGQDRLIKAVTAANPRTVVVLETGGPVLMPWLDQAPAVLQAWYPGTRGGDAIARVLFGKVAPSGRLPVSYPTDESQLPRPKLDGLNVPGGQAFEVDYSEGAAVGYKWYDRQGLTPLFPFGHGLTYTDFSYGGLKAAVKDDRITVTFDVRNTGSRAAKAVPQIYVGPKAGGWEAPRRLAGWSKIELKPGEVRHVTLTIEPRLLATFDGARGWSIAAGDYEVSLGASSRDFSASAPVSLSAKALPIRLSAKSAP
ncbi:MAG TPA: beta-glucosidase [Caulobacteraceae bacterium]